MQQRVERMTQIVRQVVSSQLVKLMPQSLVSITHIEISDDLRYATVWVSSFSQSQRSLEAVVAEIGSHREQLQQALASQLETKFVPVLRFRVDPGKDHAERVNQLLKGI